MNAKKIMGAVLVALLAAALFVGAGAAAINYGTVFVNQALDASEYNELAWGDSTGAGVVLLFDPLDGSKVYFPKAGVFTASDGPYEYFITVVSPEAVISGIAGDGTYAYSFIPGTLYTGTNVKLDVISNVITPDKDNVSLYLGYPNGDNKLIENTTLPLILDDIAAIISDENAALGEYSITAVFNATIFVNGTTVDKMQAKPVTFTIAEAGDATLSASVDQILKGDSVKLTITGQPGKKYQVKFDEAGDFADVDPKQIGLNGAAAAVDGNGFNFTMPNTGKVEVVVVSTANAEDSEKIELSVWSEGKWKKQASVTIKLSKGTITAKTDAASYFVGDIVKISGTSTAGDVNQSNLKLDGTNFVSSAGNLNDALDKYKMTGTEWSFELDTSEIYNYKAGSNGKTIDVGTYTLTITTKSGVKTTVPIVLKQPFISIIEAPEVIIQDEKAEFIINAEAAPNGIKWYIFGTNYFNASVGAVKTNVDDTTNQFKFTLDEDFTKAMDAGQYFMVIQHPMYDGKFNIGESENVFYLNTTGDAIGGENETKLFDVFGRQTANAAQALCDALDTQNIDDMYVKYSFFVVGEDESFTLSEIPATIAQGETLTISGVSTANAGEFVTVEMISTAFAAVPKDTVGSAAFIAVTTQIAEDGTWEVTFDTSDLNVDEYSLKVACAAEEKPWKNVNINVVEGADEPETPVTPEQPEQPEQPEEPVAPATPGFGALAALAGLGAVAVLLLRRE